MEGKWVEGGRGLDQATQPRAEELPAGGGGGVGGVPKGQRCRKEKQMRGLERGCRC